MIDALASIAVPIIIAFVGVLGGWLGGKAQRDQARTERDLGIVDRWEKLEASTNERFQETREELDRAKEEISDLQKRVEKFEQRDRAWRNYVNDLAAHINAKLPPPPPPLPELLR